jgi:hypothetical protein
MPGKIDQPMTDGSTSLPPSRPLSAESQNTGGPEVQQSNQDPRAELLRGIENTRLPAHLREEILAALPPEEECEEQYRKMQQEGGLSSEEFMASLSLEVERKDMPCS